MELIWGFALGLALGLALGFDIGLGIGFSVGVRFGVCVGVGNRLAIGIHMGSSIWPQHCACLNIWLVIHMICNLALTCFEHDPWLGI